VSADAACDVWKVYLCVVVPRKQCDGLHHCSSAHRTVCLVAHEVDPEQHGLVRASSPPPLSLLDRGVLGVNPEVLDC
jgi:hypothetical protein